MSTSKEAPQLWGSFGIPHQPIHETRDIVRSDLEAVKQAGDWRDDELRTANHPLGSAVIYGDCLASEQTVASSLDQALTSGDPKILTHLPGSYTTLLFQPHKLTVLGDLANQYPFYYQAEGTNVAYGSETKPLRERAAKPAADTVSLAARLAVPLPTELVAGRSATAGISRLQGGHMLTVDRYSGSVATVPYETFAYPTVKDIDEAAAALREALLESARLRAGSGYKVSADFSGGLDSTSAAYILAQTSSEPLLVTTAHTPGMASEDLEQARRLLALPESQQLFTAREYAQLDTASPYADLLNAPLGDEPDIAAVGHANERAYAQFLHDNGSELHVSGTAADCILDMAPTLYLGSLAQPGSYLKFIRSAIEAGRSSLGSPLAISREAMLQSKRDPATDLEMMSRIFLGERTPEVLRHGGWLFGPEATPRWLTPKARRELSELALARADEVGAVGDLTRGGGGREDEWDAPYARIKDTKSPTQAEKFQGLEPLA